MTYLNRFKALKLSVVEYKTQWYARLFEDGVFLQDFSLTDTEAIDLKQKLEDNSPDLTDIMLDYLMQVTP